MADEPKRRRWRRVLVGALLTWIIVYPLSIGPVWWLFKHGHITVDTYFKVTTTVYQPILLAISIFAPLANLLKWYLNLWSPVSP